MISDEELESLAKELEYTPAPFILRWATERFGTRIAATSSFQTQSLPMLHLIGRVGPAIPVLFMDTGFHFPETLRYRDQLVTRFGIHLENRKCLVGHDLFEEKYPKLSSRDPSMCCYLNKVEPLERALEGRLAWITGIRRDQTTERSKVPVISRDRNGRIKICPLVRWTQEDVLRYIDYHKLPKHPLYDRGFQSIGCWPCTQPVEGSGDPRKGRWNGLKTECGIHFVEK